MFTTLPTLVLALVHLAQAPAPADPQRVKDAVAELQKAFKEGDAPDRIRAIEHGSEVVDAQVIDWIARGLRDQAEVQKSAIEALRWMDHPEALKPLVETARRDKRLQKDAALHAALLRAIGQHPNVSSIDVLADDMWSDPDHGVIQARILALGRIRSPAAATALIGMMKVAGPNKIQPFMEDFRMSLMVLTGADQGQSQDLWLRWWNENKGKLKIEATPPQLPRLMQRKWDAYWSREGRGDKPARRGDRGGGEPGKGGSKD
jgi:hypothetical protein